jgi:hypothetical protein
VDFFLGGAVGRHLLAAAPTAPPAALGDEAADVEAAVAVGVVVVVAAEEGGLDMVRASRGGRSSYRSGGVTRGEGTEQQTACQCAGTDCTDCQATGGRE